MALVPGVTSYRVISAQRVLSIMRKLHVAFRAWV